MDRKPRRLAALVVSGLFVLLGCGAGARTTAPSPSAPSRGAAIAADGLGFDRNELSLPAGRPFRLLFENRESAPHNISLSEPSSTQPIFVGEVFSGPDSRIYDLPSIAAGTYRFRCDVHPEMSGTAVATSPLKWRWGTCRTRAVYEGHHAHDPIGGFAVTRQIAHLVRLVALPSLLMLGAASAPAVSAGNPCFHGYDMPATTIGPGTDIKLMPCAFEPTVTTVPVGTEVTFFNGPEYTHLITGANQEWGSPEAEVQPNATVTYMFDKAGVYPYACALHPGMSGAIVVGDLADVLGAGSMKTSTSGGSGASTGEGSGESNASAASTSGAEASPASPLIALAAAIGFTVLALAVWLAIRRRSVASRPLARAE